MDGPGEVPGYPGSEDTPPPTAGIYPRTGADATSESAADDLRPGCLIRVIEAGGIYKLGMRAVVFYSYLNASIGSNLDARCAGYSPKTTPTRPLNASASTMIPGRMSMGQPN